MKSNKEEPKLSSDAPKRDPKDDALGFSNFAKRLSKTIVNISSVNESFAAGGRSSHVRISRFGERQPFDFLHSIKLIINLGKILKVFKSLVIGMILFGFNSSYANEFNQLVGNSFINEYQEDIGITSDELEAMELIEKGSIVIDEQKKNEIQKLFKFNIGDENLGDLVNETEIFNEKMQLLEKADNAIDKIIGKTKVIDNDKVQEFVNNTGIFSKIDRVNDVKKDLNRSWSNVGSHFKKSGENLYNATRAAWSISRNTFLSIDKKIKKIKGLNAALNVGQAADLVNLSAAIGKAIYANDNGDQSTLNENMIDAFQIVIDDLTSKGYNSKIGRSGPLLAAANNVGKLIEDFEALKSLNDVNEGLFSDKALSLISNKRQEIINNIKNTSTSLASNLLSGVDVLNISDIASDLTGVYYDTKKVTAKYRMKSYHEIKKESNKRLDLVLADMGKTQKFVKGELVGAILNDGIKLDVELGFREGPEKAKKYEENLKVAKKYKEDLKAVQEELEKAEQQGQIAQEVKGLKGDRESTKVVQRTRLTEAIAQAKVLQKNDAKLSKEYQDLYVEFKQSPNDETLQKRLDEKLAKLVENTAEFIEVEKAVISSSEGHTNANGVPFYKGTKIIDANGDPIFIDGNKYAKVKAENNWKALSDELSKRQSIAGEPVKREQIAKSEKSEKIKANVANWQSEKKSKQAQVDVLVADLTKTKEANQPLDTKQVSELKQLKKDIAKLDKTIKLASANAGLPITVPTAAEKKQNKKSLNSDLAKNRQALDKGTEKQVRLAKKIQSKNVNLRKLNSEMNSKISEINSLKQELEQMSSEGSASSKSDRFKARANLIKYGLVKRIYDKYNGDITKLSNVDKAKIRTLSKTLSGNWVRIFLNAPSRYANARDINNQLSSAGGSSSDAQFIRQKISQLESQVATLMNEIGRMSKDREQTLVIYQQGAEELQRLIGDVNDTAKAQQGASLVNLPFYGLSSYLGENFTGSRIFGGYFAISTSNDFSVENQNIDFRSGDSKDFITPNINTGSGDHFDGYRYVAWGQWNASGHQIVEGPDARYGRITTEISSALGGWWTLGQEAHDVPTQGHAIYTGEMRGDFINASGIAQRGAITGDIGFAVNFGANTISSNGNIKVNDSQIDAFSLSPVNFNNIDQENTGNINLEYWFEMEGDASSGRNFNLAGSLNGKNGSEISGAFEYNAGNANNANTGSGVFRAKQ